MTPPATTRWRRPGRGRTRIALVALVALIAACDDGADDAGEATRPAGTQETPPPTTDPAQTAGTQETPSPQEAPSPTTDPTQTAGTQETPPPTTVAASAGTPADPVEADAAWCGAWYAFLASGDDTAFLDALADPPAPIAADAETLLRDEAAQTAGERAPPAEVDRAGATVLAWAAVACSPDAAHGDAAADQRIAPPLAAVAGDYAVCSLPLPQHDGGGRIVIYGDRSLPDPYDGEMLAVVSDAEQSMAGDGDRTPVTVRGVTGTAAPFTVFQQVVLPELGTVVTWEEDGRFAGLFGRGYAPDRTDELVALADRLVAGPDGLTFPPGALPGGVGEVYRGPSTRLGLVLASGQEYRITYRPAGDGQVTLVGSVESPESFDAFRFFTRPLERRTAGNREVLAGNAWNDSGPSLVTWLEPSGLAVRIVGLGVDLEEVERLAALARPLDRAEWERLALTTDGCSTASGHGSTSSTPP